MPPLVQKCKKDKKKLKKPSLIKTLLQQTKNRVIFIYYQWRDTHAAKRDFLFIKLSAINHLLPIHRRRAQLMRYYLGKQPTIPSNTPLLATNQWPITQLLTNSTPLKQLIQVTKRPLHTYQAFPKQRWVPCYTLPLALRYFNSLLTILSSRHLTAIFHMLKGCWAVIHSRPPEKPQRLIIKISQPCLKAAISKPEQPHFNKIDYLIQQVILITSEMNLAPLVNQQATAEPAPSQPCNFTAPSKERNLNKPRTSVKKRTLKQKESPQRERINPEFLSHPHPLAKSRKRTSHSSSSDTESPPPPKKMCLQSTKPLSGNIVNNTIPGLL